MIDESQPQPSKHELPECTTLPVVIGICVLPFAAFTVYYEKRTVIPQTSRELQLQDGLL